MDTNDLVWAKVVNNGGARKLGPGSELHTKIVGVTKRNDEGRGIQKILREMSEEYCDGSPLELEHEEDNPYDENAIKVFYEGEHIGYINRDLSEDLVKFVDADMVDAEISEITGGEDGKSFGCNIFIRIGEKQEVSSGTIESTKKEYSTPKATAPVAQKRASDSRIKYGIVGGIVVFAAILAAMGWVMRGVGDSPADDNYTVVTSGETGSAGLDERNALKAEIMEIITGYGLPDTSEIVLVDNRIEISAPTEYSVDSVPETWESILQEAESTGIALQSDFPDYTITIMYKDGTGNILLNVTDGACKYNAFEIETDPVTEEENPPTITLEEYNQIETGMTYFQVCDIIGGYGEVLSEVDLGIGSEYATEMYMWEGEGITGANANVTFQGGKVTAKAQFGLE